MKIDIEEANKQFLMLLEYVVAGGEVTITKANSPVAKLVPAEAKSGDAKKSKLYTEKQGQYWPLSITIRSCEDSPHPNWKCSGTSR